MPRLCLTLSASRSLKLARRDAAVTVRLVRSAMVSAIRCEWLARGELAKDLDAFMVAVLEEDGVGGLLECTLTRLLTGVDLGADGPAAPVAVLVEVRSASLSVEYSESLPSSGSESALSERAVTADERRTGL